MRVCVFVRGNPTRRGTNARQSVSSLSMYKHFITYENWPMATHILSNESVCVCVCVGVRVFLPSFQSCFLAPLFCSTHVSEPRKQIKGDHTMRDMVVPREEWRARLPGVQLPLCCSAGAKVDKVRPRWAHEICTTPHHLHAEIVPQGNAAGQGLYTARLR